MSFDIYLGGIILIGLLHGLEPGHGWPIAFLSVLGEPKPYLRGFITSLVLSLCHFFSSIIAALVYVLVSQFIAIPDVWLKLGAVVLLIFLGIRFWREKVDTSSLPENQHEHFHGNLTEISHSHAHQHFDGTQHFHEHTHPKSTPITLRALAIYGFLLGFAHEEEFALLALAAGGVSPWLLMSIYGFCVSLSLIGITLLCIRIYTLFLPFIRTKLRYISKISAITLFLLALSLIIEILIQIF